MKRKRQIVGLILVSLMVSGCATPYMVDRGRDAADIFTVTYGENLGAKARVGPIHAGLFAGRDIAGLRAGEFSTGFVGASDVDFPILEIDLTVLSCDSFVATNLPAARARGKLSTAIGYVVAIEQGKMPWRQKIPYYTEANVAVGMFRGARLGLNVGEFLDFLLGWTTLDLFQDDIEERNRKSNNLQQATR